MSRLQGLINELSHEAELTRNVLAAIPYDKAMWQPHEKSMSLIALATHIAELGTWVSVTLDYPELDFAKGYVSTPQPASTEELLALHDNSIASALECLNRIDDSTLNEDWTMRNGDTIYFTMPKIATLRRWVYNHLYHHRGQLTVYLRLLDIPVPSTFGPTADVQSM